MKPGRAFEGVRRRLRLGQQVRQHLDREPSEQARWQQIEGRLDQLERRQSPLEEIYAAEARTVESIERRVEAVEARAAEALENLRRLDQSSRARLDQADRLRDRAAFIDQIPAVTAWVASSQVSSPTPITVIMATYNRAELVARAVRSVQAQVHQEWQLVVVNDGSTDDTAQVLAELAGADPRVLPVNLPHGGQPQALNRGLAEATGEIVCYLDDDNTMEALWLKAVAWAFDRQPGLDMLYGARVQDGGLDGDRRSMPWIHFEPFDRENLETYNFMDLGTMAHRRDLPGAGFDETLRAGADWDLALRLTEDRVPLALPVVGSVYSVSAPNRVSQSQVAQGEYTRIAIRARRSSSLRVLAYNALFPLVTETYIGEEMRAFTAMGADLAWCTADWSPSPLTVDEPRFDDLDTAVDSFAPDLIFTHWADFAAGTLDHFSRLGVPFALRVHSYDFDPGLIEHISRHPLCIGVWAYPHHARHIPGAHELVALVADVDEFPPPAAERPVVLTVAAALPKRDWPMLVDAFADLASKGIDCRIVVGLTQGFERGPELIRDLIQERQAPIKLSVDVPHDQVIDLLSRTALVVYTKADYGPFGMPRSIIEGMMARTSVVLPDREEARLVAGAHCRTYLTSNDIVRHALEVLGGGPNVDAEREYNRQFALTHFADPRLARAFVAQVTSALRRWRSP